MPDDECPDFDRTLRKMLDTPPTPHKPRATESEPDSDDVVEPHEDDPTDADG